MKKTVQLLSILMVVCMLLSSCAQGTVGLVETIQNGATENGAQGAGDVAGNAPQNLSAGNYNNLTPEKGTYNEGAVLVKYDGEMSEALLAELSVASAEALYKGSSWYLLTLIDGEDTVDAVNRLRTVECLEKADYDYVMGLTADMASVDVSCNPNYESQKHHGTHKIPEGWEEVNPGIPQDQCQPWSLILRFQPRLHTRS